MKNKNMLKIAVNKEGMNWKEKIRINIITEAFDNRVFDIVK
jgi:hypothetical protein